MIFNATKQDSFFYHKKGDIALQYVILFSALTLGILTLGTLFQTLFTTQTCIIREKILSLTVSSSLKNWDTITGSERRQLIWKQKIRPFLKESFAYGENNEHITLQDYLPIYLREHEGKKGSCRNNQTQTARIFYEEYLDSSDFFNTQDTQNPRIQNDRTAIQKLQRYINKNLDNKSLQQFFSP